MRFPLLGERAKVREDVNTYFFAALVCGRAAAGATQPRSGEKRR